MRLKFVVVAIAVLFFIFIAWLVYTYSTIPGDYDDFSKCLTDEGFIMAGTDWCHFCKDQKRMFGASFKYINYKNCDFEKAWCDEKGVTGYPTWVSPDGSKYPGLQSLQRLSELSNCSLK